MFYESKYTFLFNLYIPIKILKGYCSHSSCSLFFNVNDIAGLAITCDFKQADISLS